MKSKITLALWSFFVAMMLIIFMPGSRHDGRDTMPVQRSSAEPQTNGGDTGLTAEKERDFEDAVFPDEFFFGTASSDFQSTGGNGLTDWNVFIDSPDFKDEDGNPLVKPGTSNDYLNRYREDYDLAGQISDLVHRISFEWARIEPEEGKWNMDAVREYTDQISYAQSKGLTIMICGNHFALPLWAVLKGGLENPRFPYYYSRYMGFLAREIGKPLNIKWWLTFNEPQIILKQSYGNGGWPPHKFISGPDDNEGSRRFIYVMMNIIDAHRLSYRTIHKVLGKNAMVSFASAPGAFYPLDPGSVTDRTAFNLHDIGHSLLFDHAVGRTDRDFIGINFYGRYELKMHVSRPGAILSWLKNEIPVDIEWLGPERRPDKDHPRELYPTGLYDTIMKYRSFGLPIVVTENGISDPDDRFREEFLVVHLKAVHDAIQDGADVIGYQYWALTDTWEWDGFFSHFGLIEIDRGNNLARRLRPSAVTYGQIAKSGIIPRELLEKYRKYISRRVK